MNYYNFQTVLQEVPGEISLCFSISGCPLQCKGCHSPFLWKKSTGLKLTEKQYIEILKQYKNLATCVLFMGGEWHEKELIDFLKLARSNNYKTCLYTGEEQVTNPILEVLTWVKTGPWIQALGGLNCPTTNQKFIETKTNRLLNHLFIKN